MYNVVQKSVEMGTNTETLVPKTRTDQSKVLTNAALDVRHVKDAVGQRYKRHTMFDGDLEAMSEKTKGVNQREGLEAKCRWRGCPKTIRTPPCSTDRLI